MGDRRCCCESDCLILEDDFERADNDDIGSDWNEIYGDWEIISGDLVATELPALIVTTKKNSKSRRGFFSGLFTLEGSGPWEIQFLLNATSTGGFYQSTSFDCTELTANVESRSFDTNSFSGKKPPTWVWNGASGRTFSFNMELTEGLIYLWISDQDFVYDANYPSTYMRYFSGCSWDIHTGLSTTGRGYAGLIVTSGEVHFHSVRYEQHFLDDQECPTVACPCAWETGKYIPQKIRIDFTDDGGCSGVDGDSLLFESVGCDINGDYELFVCTDGTLNGEDQSWYTKGWWDGGIGMPRLDCSLNLAVEVGCGWDVKAVESVQCDPFIAVWTHTAPEEGCEACGPSGQFTATATEET